METLLLLVWGESIYGGSFEDEFSLEAFNLYGALSMANAGPNTNGSQFFVVQMKEVPDTILISLLMAVGLNQLLKLMQKKVEHLG